MLSTFQSSVKQTHMGGIQTHDLWDSRAVSSALYQGKKCPYALSLFKNEAYMATVTLLRFKFFHYTTLLQMK